jgi:hypothetical protein
MAWALGLPRTMQATMTMLMRMTKPVKQASRSGQCHIPVPRDSHAQGSLMKLQLDAATALPQAFHTQYPASARSLGASPR